MQLSGQSSLPLSRCTWLLCGVRRTAGARDACPKLKLAIIPTSLDIKASRGHEPSFFSHFELYISFDTHASLLLISETVNSTSPIEYIIQPNSNFEHNVPPSSRPPKPPLQHHSACPQVGRRQREGGRAHGRQDGVANDCEGN
jgi:hypothetical protein